MKPIDVFFQGERIREMQLIEAGGDQTLASIKSAILEKHGGEADTLLFLEDGDDPLDESLAASAVASATGLKIHLHRCRRVAVAVRFVAETAERHFGPGATVGAVKRWAAERQFGMTKEEAGEHVLQLAGTQDRPAPGVHIGTLVSSTSCGIAFDLVPDERINGESGVTSAM